MIKAILFDSDGVLVDTERLFFEATREAFLIDGVVLSPSQWAIWYLAESKSSRDIGLLLGISSSQIEKTIKNRDQLFWSKVEAGVSVFPGVRDTLLQLSNEFRLAIVTGASRSHFERVHLFSNLIDFFELIITYDDYDEPKPSPQCYLRTLQRLSLEPLDCLAVEDSPRGAKAAISAGMRCAVIPTSLTNLALCPKECDILNNISELSRLTKNGR